MITPADVAHMLSHGGRERARGAFEEDTLLYTSQTVITSEQEQITTVHVVQTTVHSVQNGAQNSDAGHRIENNKKSDVSGQPSAREVQSEQCEQANEQSELEKEKGGQ